MKTDAQTVSPEQRTELFRRPCEQLGQGPGVRFAYLYGSVLESDRVHDVDVGLFLDDAAAPRKGTITDNLSVKLTAAVGLPVDAGYSMRRRSRFCITCCGDDSSCVETRSF